MKIRRAGRHHRNPRAPGPRAGLAVTARKLGIPVYFTEATHRAWMRWMTPRKRMTYAEWLANAGRRRKLARMTAPVPSGTPCRDRMACDEEEETLEHPTKRRRPIPAALPAVEYFHHRNGFSIGDIAVTPLPFRTMLLIRWALSSRRKAYG